MKIQFRIGALSFVSASIALAAAPAISALAAEPDTLTPAQLKQGIEARHPADYYKLAGQHDGGPGPGSWIVMNCSPTGCAPSSFPDAETQGRGQRPASELHFLPAAGAGTASEKRMPHRKIGQLSAWRPLLMGTALLLVALHAVPAEARTRRRQRPNAFQVALQPFKLARSVVHAVADPIVEPIVHQAPRAALALATAPLRAARASREVVRGEQVSEDEIETAAEPARGRAVRVAYMVPHGPRELPPPDESDDAVADEPLREFDQEEEDATRAAPAPMTSGNRPTVAGRRAVLRNGIAYAPSEAPARVKNAIWAANTLRRKPYLWGGGHGSFYDRGYDCSGTVSFALHGAGLLGAPLPSSDLMGYGERGRGRWFTIYVRPGHTFAVIAGLRLDTTDFQNGGNTGPRWHADMRDTRGYVVRHPAGM